LTQSKEQLGLEKYSDFEASMILDLAKGDFNGKDEFEQSMEELERWIASSSLPLRIPKQLSKVRLRAWYRGWSLGK